jgi:hypothetical protein
MSDRIGEHPDVGSDLFSHVDIALSQVEREESRMSGRYYRALSVMHQRVQGNIDELERSPQPDWAQIGELKRLKLSIKDRMKSSLKDGREVEPQRSFARVIRRQGQSASLSSDA